MPQEANLDAWSGQLWKASVLGISIPVGPTECNLSRPVICFL